VTTRRNRGRGICLLLLVGLVAQDRVYGDGDVFGTFFRLFGQWAVGPVAGYASVGALTAQEANAMLGTKLQYSPNAAVVGGKLTRDPTYEITWLSEYDLWTELRTQMGSVGLTGPGVLMISVTGSEIRSTDFGTLVIVGENGRFLVFWEGAYFELLGRE
jgi:hypothetical protein